MFYSCNTRLMSVFIRTPFVLLLLSVSAFTYSQTAFIAVPDTHNGQSIDGVSASLEHQVRIEQRGQKFIWSSNGNVGMTRVFQGSDIVFIADGGQGLIVILNQSGLPENEREGDGRPFLYCEHIRTGLRIDSYCGGTQSEAVIGG